MKLSIIAPLANMEFIAEYTDFDVALGYMALRYERYMRTLQSLKFLRREIHLTHMPGHIIRDDYYFTAGRRIKPNIMVTPPGQNEEDAYEKYLLYLRSAKNYEELSNTKIVPLITSATDEKLIALYNEIAKLKYVQWNVFKDLPLKFAHTSIVLGMTNPDDLKTAKPVGLVTAVPVMYAQLGHNITDDVALPIEMEITPDWMLRPLDDSALALAVENIKELRNVVANPKK